VEIIAKLNQIWSSVDSPFLIHSDGNIKFSDLKDTVDLSNVQFGDVVAVIGDFNPLSISVLLRLIDLGAIVVPLTTETVNDHEYFFETALVDYIIDGEIITKREHNDESQYLKGLKSNKHAGLILFSSGTTGRPKAILHNLSLFLKRFETPRATLRTINFLLFDHIGGINTLLHTLFNKGIVVAVQDRTVSSVLSVCEKNDVELLPTTPTFLRMMLMSGAVPDKIPKTLKIITYGTERMDQPTLDQLCHLLPDVDFRQTFGMSELGIVRVKSESRNSLFMKIGGEGVETRVVDDVLHIRSQSRMEGYLNADSPFDKDGWYNTKDVVERKGDYYRVSGRINDVINVGGLKFMASEVENVALMYPHVSLVQAVGRNNPITGQHLELTVQADDAVEFNKDEFQNYLTNNLQSHMVPRRVKVGQVSVGHRFKKS